MSNLTDFVWFLTNLYPFHHLSIRVGKLHFPTISAEVADAKSQQRDSNEKVMEKRFVGALNCGLLDLTYWISDIIKHTKRHEDRTKYTNDLYLIILLTVISHYVNQANYIQ